MLRKKCGTCGLEATWPTIRCHRCSNDFDMSGRCPVCNAQHTMKGLPTHMRVHKRLWK